jgi:hypothetical protein
MPENDVATGQVQQRNRGHILRDVIVFQLKMLLGGARDFALIPVSLGAALFDLVHKHEKHGYYFYKVLRWARQSEEMISLYTPVKDEPAMTGLNPNYSVDAVVTRIEEVVVREYQKGSTAATMKDAIENVARQLREKGKDLAKSRTL